MSDENNTPPKSANEKGFLQNIWESSALKPVRGLYKTGKILTSPVWAPTIAAGKVAWWGLKRESTAAKVIVPAFAAAALTGYAYVGSYLGMYGAVAAGDYYWFGQAYSEGERTGRISKLSMVGKFPCNTIEGELAMPNLSSGGSSTFTFSARSLGPLNDDVIAQLREAYEEGYPVSLTYKQSHWPVEMFDREQEGWFFPHLSGFSCYQKTDYNIVAVTPRPGADIPAAPRFPEERQP